MSSYVGTFKNYGCSGTSGGTSRLDTTKLNKHAQQTCNVDI